MNHSFLAGIHLTDLGSGTVLTICFGLLALAAVTGLLLKLRDMSPEPRSSLDSGWNQAAAARFLAAVAVLAGLYFLGPTLLYGYFVMDDFRMIYEADRFTGLSYLGRRHFDHLLPGVRAQTKLCYGMFGTQSLFYNGALWLHLVGVHLAIGILLLRFRVKPIVAAAFIVTVLSWAQWSEYAQGYYCMIADFQAIGVCAFLLFWWTRCADSASWRIVLLLVSCLPAFNDEVGVWVLLVSPGFGVIVMSFRWGSDGLRRDQLRAFARGIALAVGLLGIFVLFYVFASGPNSAASAALKWDLARVISVMRLGVELIVYRALPSLTFPSQFPFSDASLFGPLFRGICGSALLAVLALGARRGGAPLRLFAALAMFTCLVFAAVVALARPEYIAFTLAKYSAVIVLFGGAALFACLQGFDGVSVLRRKWSAERLAILAAGVFVAGSYVNDTIYVQRGVENPLVNRFSSWERSDRIRKNVHYLTRTFGRLPGESGRRTLKLPEVHASRIEFLFPELTLWDLSVYGPFLNSGANRIDFWPQPGTDSGTSRWMDHIPTATAEPAAVDLEFWNGMLETNKTLWPFYKPVQRQAVAESAH